MPEGWSYLSLCWFGLDHCILFWFVVRFSLYRSIWHWIAVVPFKFVGRMHYKGSYQSSSLCTRITAASFSWQHTTFGCAQQLSGADFSGWGPTTLTMYRGCIWRWCCNMTCHSHAAPRFGCFILPQLSPYTVNSSPSVALIVWGQVALCSRKLKNTAWYRN